MTDSCRWNIAWVGNCMNQPEEGSRYCKIHHHKCHSCGAEATHDCSETMMFVCGFPLCDDCEHTIRSNGCNGGGELPEGYGMHCKKTEQKFRPWYSDPEHVLRPS